MDEAVSLLERVMRSGPVSTRRRAKRPEYTIYLEDVIAQIPNKYLAANVASLRARQLNERALPVGEVAKQAEKPTTQALLDLIEGHLTYEIERPAPEIRDGDLDFDDIMDEDVAGLFDEYEVTASADIRVGDSGATKDIDDTD